MSIFESLFSTADSAAKSENKAAKKEVNVAKTSKRNKPIPGVDVLETPSNVIVRIDYSRCKRVHVSYVPKRVESVGYTKIPVAENLRIKLTAEEAEENVNYISRGIMPEDVEGIAWLGAEVYANVDLERVVTGRTTFDEKKNDNSIQEIVFEKVMPEGAGTLTF